MEMKNGKRNETGVFVRVFCLSTFSPPNYTTSPFLSIYLSEKRGPGHFQRGFEKNQTFVRVWEHKKDAPHNTPRRILTQKGATAANKTSKPTLVGGGPLREGIRFQGNVFKIEFLEALSLYVFRTVSSAKATALTWPRSFLSSNFSSIESHCSCTYSHTLQSEKHVYPTSLPAAQMTYKSQIKKLCQLSLCLFKKPQKHHSKLHHQHKIQLAPT